LVRGLAATLCFQSLTFRFFRFSLVDFLENPLPPRRDFLSPLPLDSLPLESTPWFPRPPHAVWSFLPYLNSTLGVLIPRVGVSLSFLQILVFCHVVKLLFPVLVKVPCAFFSSRRGRVRGFNPFPTFVFYVYDCFHFLLFLFLFLV